MASAGVDVAAIEIDAGAGGGGDADHEIAGGGGDLERDLHGLIHGQHFYRSGTDAEEAGERARAEHQAESRRDALHIVVPQSAFFGGEVSIQLQARGPGIGSAGCVERGFAACGKGMRNRGA